MEIRYEEVEKEIAAINKDELSNYRSYWNGIAPISPGEFLQRWIFAFTSIHTTWKNNVRGYLMLKDYQEWMDNRALLADKVKEARIGLDKVRTRGLWEFAHKFWDNTVEFMSPHDLRSKRDRWRKELFGIGKAKVSFALEMCFPLTCDVVCLDTHILQKYGIKSDPSPKRYRELEEHWVKSCGTLVSPTLIRHMIWDAKQNQHDTRYWSYVFEGTSMTSSSEQIHGVLKEKPTSPRKAQRVRANTKRAGADDQQSGAEVQ